MIPGPERRSLNRCVSGPCFLSLAKKHRLSCVDQIDPQSQCNRRIQGPEEEKSLKAKANCSIMKNDCLNRFEQMRTREVSADAL